VAAGTLALTVLLYVLVPKGFFPVQDTGAIQAITEAPQSISFPAMSGRQQAVAEVVLEDPAVESLSSFIGVDGTNATLNSGRMLISLKPLGERDASASEVIRRLQAPSCRTWPASGCTCSRCRTCPSKTGPAAPSTSSAQSARTRRSSPNGCRAWSTACAPRPELADVASDLQDHGLQAWVDIDRNSASRLGVSPAAIDNALYNAFGQRLISTIFTQSTQYRVVLEVKPEFRSGCPEPWPTCTSPAPAGAGAPVGGGAHQRAAGTLAVNTSASFRRSPCPSTSRRAWRWATRWRPSVPPRPSWACRQHRDAASRARPWPSRPPWTNTLLLILAAVVTMYIVLGVLYESYHPPGDHPVHPALSRRGRPAGPAGGAHRAGHVGIIGIVLLIGIVKKNAIMMIDFALDARAGQGLAPRGDLPGLPAALPAHPDDHPGGPAGGAAADAGRRRRLGAAPAPGHHHGRRPAGQPGAHAVHHAGDLPGLRPRRPSAGRPPSHDPPAAAPRPRATEVAPTKPHLPP
jgi:multidrug efflux pump